MVQIFFHMIPLGQEIKIETFALITPLNQPYQTVQFQRPTALYMLQNPETDYLERTLSNPKSKEHRTKIQTFSEQSQMIIQLFNNQQLETRHPKDKEITQLTNREYSVQIQSISNNPRDPFQDQGKKINGLVLFSMDLSLKSQLVRSQDKEMQVLRHYSEIKELISIINLIL